MKITFILICTVLICTSTSATAQVLKDNDLNNFTVQFNKISYDEGWACTAFLNVNYEATISTVILTFEVPNYDVRYKTTKADYAVIKLNNIDLRLQNQVEHDADDLIQKFSLSISKNTAKELFSSGLKSVIFYFEPNQDFIKQKLNLEIGLNPGLKETLLENSNKTVTTTISKPNIKALNEVKLWIEKL